MADRHGAGLQIFHFSNDRQATFVIRMPADIAVLDRLAVETWALPES